LDFLKMELQIEKSLDFRFRPAGEGHFVLARGGVHRA
jgi:hypothetical protein